MNTLNKLGKLSSVLDTINLKQTIEGKVKKEEEQLNDANIIIAGKSGVGKSTLINAAFREDLAQTGTGKPVTDEIKLIEKEGVPIKIYDTVGFELDRSAQKRAIKEIKKIIVEKASDDNPHNDIHAMWYCIAAPSDRIEDVEIEFIQDIANENIPIILVLTKVYSKASATKFAETIRAMNLPIKAIIQVLALGEEDFAAFGVKELVEKTNEILPEAIESAFVNAQKASFDLKRKKANIAINASLILIFGQGMAPVPFADAPMMIATQATMLARITVIYGVNVDKKTAETVIAGILGVSISTILGRSMASNLLKLIPGGNIVGGAISGGVGSVITKALGKTYMELMEKVLLGEIDLSIITENDLTKMFKDVLQNYVDNK